MTIRLDAHKPEFHRAAPPQLPVRVATTASVTISVALNAGDTIDGVTLAAGDRVLVKDQSTGAQNGVYIAGPTPARAFDMEEGIAAYGAVIYVVAGTANGGKTFRNTNTTVPTIGTTALTFADYTPGSGGGGGTDMEFFNVEDYGAVHDAASISDADIAAATDDTSAIQDAIDACFAAGGGVVWFPRGIYAIKGALVSTSTFNSQLTVPYNGSSLPVAIEFLGSGPNTTYNGTLEPGSGSILRSDWNGSISGNPAIISAGTFRTIASGSNVMVSFENLVIVAHDDPKLTALQMTCATNVRTRNIQIRTTTPAPAGLPSHANSVGYEGPWGLLSTVPSYHIGMDVYGFQTGIVPEEQFHGIDIGVAFCGNAMKFVGGQGSPTHTHYPVTITRLVYTWCPYGLVFETDLRWVDIGMLAVEHDSGAFTPVADIYDPSELARGFIRYHALSFSGTMEDLIFDGGSHLSLHWGHDQYWKLNSVVDIPEGTNPSTDPDTGRRLYADSSSGDLTGRKPDGSTYDYEKLGGTVSLTGTPSAGYVPTATSSSAATWQAQSGGGAAGHYEVIVDGTAPPVAVTNVAEDDWVYGFVPD